MNDTVGSKDMDEQERLRQMRRDAVEEYKQQLVDLIQSRIDEHPDDGKRNIGIIRGMTNCKSLIQSHVIKVQ
jgi:hypothetical protein